MPRIPLDYTNENRATEIRNAAIPVKQLSSSKAYPDNSQNVNYEKHLSECLMEINRQSKNAYQVDGTTIKASIEELIFMVSPTALNKKSRNVVFDLTEKCPWGCAICCMSAKYPGTSTCELNTQEKWRVLEEIIVDGNFSIDFSGGEPLLDKDSHFPLIQRASQALGKQNIGLSCSGAYISDSEAAFIAEFCGDVELTLDCAPSRPYSYRPAGYHATAFGAAQLLKAHGASVGLQTVATTANTDSEMWAETYQSVCDAGADEWSILRYQICGRGEDYPELFLSAESCAELVRRTKKMEKENLSQTKPKISFSYLMPGHDRYADACRCVKKSVGIIGNRVLSCFWGIDKFGELYDQRFLLGHLPDQSFGECITGENAQYWMNNSSLCQLCDTCASAA